jgi:hypothetical protein
VHSERECKGRSQPKYTSLRTRWSKHSGTISDSLRLGVPWITDDHSSRRFQKRRRRGCKHLESPSDRIWTSGSETMPFSCNGRGKISFATTLRRCQPQILSIIASRLDAIASQYDPSRGCRLRRRWHGCTAISQRWKRRVLLTGSIHHRVHHPDL